MEKRGNFVFSIVDTAIDAERVPFERAFYRAFGHMDNLDHLWEYNHKSRSVSTKIPYTTQDVFVAKLGERIIAGAGVNFGLSNILQLEMEGFSLNKAPLDYCEILHMFCLLDLTNGTPMLQSFTLFFMEKLMARGIKRIYGTCSERRVRPYQMIGLSVIGERMYNNEKVYLLEMNLDSSNKYVQLLLGKLKL